MKTIGTIDPAGVPSVLHRTVSRVSPLCAAFCPDCECVRGATGKADVAPTCARNAKSQSSNAIAILRRRSGMDETSRLRRAKDIELSCRAKEPASHLASRRSTGSLPNAVCGQQPAPTSIRNGGNMRKRQAIQHPDFSRRIWRQSAEKRAQAHMTSERLCDRVLSRKTDCDSGRAERSSAAAESHRQQSQPTGGAGEHGESPVRQSGCRRANSVAGTTHQYLRL